MGPKFQCPRLLNANAVALKGTSCVPVYLPLSRSLGPRLWRHVTPRRPMMEWPLHDAAAMRHEEQAASIGEREKKKKKKGSLDRSSFQHFKRATL